MVSATAYNVAAKSARPAGKPPQSERPLFFRSDPALMEQFISNLYSPNVPANMLAIRYFVIENNLLDLGGRDFANAFFYLTNERALAFNAPLICCTVSFLRNLLGMFFAKIEFNNHGVAKNLVVDFFKMLNACAMQHCPQMVPMKVDPALAKKPFFH
uniref:DSPn domain-containing protein n=2 Tax=Steinernema glaseri TaxID=37863 RepID=A0A1I7YYI0_9BILA